MKNLFFIIVLLSLFGCEEEEASHDFDIDEYISENCVGDSDMVFYFDSFNPDCF